MGDVVTEAEQDRALFVAWKGGDESARGRLFARLARIARKVAGKYARDSEAEDVFSEATVGICEAVDEWDPAGQELGLFAYFRARDRVVNYFTRNVFPARKNTVSLYAFSSTEQIAEWRSEGMQERAALVAEVQAIAKDVLPPNEMDVILLRAMGMTGPAIAKKRRVDRSQICRREKAAMNKLTAAVTEDD